MAVMDVKQQTALAISLVVCVSAGLIAIATTAYLLHRKRRNYRDGRVSKENSFITKILAKLMAGWGREDRGGDDSMTKVLTPVTNRTISITNRSRDSIASVVSNLTDLSTFSSQQLPPQSPMRKQMSLQLPSISVTSTSPSDHKMSLLSPRRKSHQLQTDSYQAFLTPINNSSRRSSNNSLQEEDLCGINPSLYKRRYSAEASVSSRDDLDDDDDDSDDLSPDYIGRVRFSLEYSEKAEKLTVVLHQARHLPLKNSHVPDSCDPFFKLVLLPDLRSQVKTSFKKKTCNPKFEESFVFQVASKDLEERILKMTAYDVDKIRRHNVIGHVKYCLRDLVAGEDEGGKKVTVIRDLETEECTDDKGEMLVSLCHNNVTERLTVGVFEARKLKKPNDHASSDYYVKVVLMKNNSVMKKKKSDVLKNELDPKFNISFTFKQLSESLLSSSCVVLSLMQHLPAHKDKMVGRVVVGSFMHARGRELEHWDDLITKPKETITCWHNLT